MRAFATFQTSSVRSPRPCPLSSDLLLSPLADAGRELLLKLAALMDIHPRRVARAKEMAEAAAKLAAKPSAPAAPAPGKKGGKKHR